MSDAEVLALALQRVKCFAVPERAFPEPHMVKMYRSRWASDPYAMGCYSYWAKGNLPGMFTG